MKTFCRIMLHIQIRHFYSLFPVNWLLAYKHCHDMLHGYCNNIYKVAGLLC
jgi:hypothetical protein